MLSGCDLQVRKVAFGAGSHPESNRTLGIPMLHVVHHEAGLLRAVNVEAGVGSIDNDLELGPDARLEVDVRLIFLRRFLS